MLLLAFGPFTLVTERADDDRTGLEEADHAFSVGLHIYVRLSVCLSPPPLSLSLSHCLCVFVHVCWSVNAVHLRSKTHRTVS